jgi:hypothetical protein
MGLVSARGRVSAVGMMPTSGGPAKQACRHVEEADACCFPYGPVASGKLTILAEAAREGRSLIFTFALNLQSKRTSRSEQKTYLEVVPALSDGMQTVRLAQRVNTSRQSALDQTATKPGSFSALASNVAVARQPSRRWRASRRQSAKSAIDFLHE